MKLYRINQLFTWWGDHFNESYEYREVGITEDAELAEYLKTLKVSKDVAEHSNWPKSCMQGYPWYEIEELETLKLSDIKVGRSEEMMNEDR